MLPTPTQGLEIPQKGWNPVKSTVLGHIQPNPASIVTVTLLEDTDIPAAYREPAIIRVFWPPDTTTVSVKAFPLFAGQMAHLFADAATTLASIKVSRPL